MRSRAVFIEGLETDNVNMAVESYETVGDLAQVEFVLEIPFVRLRTVDDLPTMVAAFTTDIPAFAGAWGTPYLIGPGSIHVAHTSEERIPKKELLDAVDIYARMVAQLLVTGRGTA
jgi:acetylornithine deacetylase